jgi:hypothetical protein
MKSKEFFIKNIIFYLVICIKNGRELRIYLSALYYILFFELAISASAIAEDRQLEMMMSDVVG